MVPCPWCGRPGMPSEVILIGGPFVLGFFSFKKKSQIKSRPILIPSAAGGSGDPGRAWRPRQEIIECSRCAPRPKEGPGVTFSRNLQGARGDAVHVDYGANGHGMNK